MLPPPGSCAGIHDRSLAVNTSLLCHNLSCVVRLTQNAYKTAITVRRHFTCQVTIVQKSVQASRLLISSGSTVIPDGVIRDGGYIQIYHSHKVGHAIQYLPSRLVRRHRTGGTDTARNRQRLDKNDDSEERPVVHSVLQGTT